MEYAAVKSRSRCIFVAPMIVERRMYRICKCIWTTVSMARHSFWEVIVYGKTMLGSLLDVESDELHVTYNSGLSIRHWLSPFFHSTTLHRSITLENGANTLDIPYEHIVYRVHQITASLAPQGTRNTSSASSSDLEISSQCHHHLRHHHLRHRYLQEEVCPQKR